MAFLSAVMLLRFVRYFVFLFYFQFFSTGAINLVIVVEATCLWNQLVLEAFLLFVLSKLTLASS